MRSRQLSDRQRRKVLLVPDVGILARTVRDAAALLDAMAVPMPGNPWSVPPLAPGDSFLTAVDRPTGRLRIGRYAQPVTPEVELDPCSAPGTTRRIVFLNSSNVLRFGSPSEAM